MQTQCMAPSCTHASTATSSVSTVQLQLRSTPAAAHSFAAARLVRHRHAQPLKQRQSTLVARAEGSSRRPCRVYGLWDPAGCVPSGMAELLRPRPHMRSIMHRWQCRGDCSTVQAGDLAHGQCASAPAQAAGRERRRGTAAAYWRQVRRVLRQALSCCQCRTPHLLRHRPTQRSSTLQVPWAPLLTASHGDNSQA